MAPDALENEHCTDAPARPQLPVAGAEPGIEPHELLDRPTRKGSVQVICLDYSPDQCHVEEVTNLKDFLSRHRPSWSAVRWISVRGLGDMETIHGLAEKYGLHPLAIEDVLNPQRPKVEDFSSLGDQPGRLFVVARGISCSEAKLRSKQVSLFLGRHTLISFEGERSNLFEKVRTRSQKAGSRVRVNDASFLLYTLLDVLIDDLFPILEDFGVRVERLEANLIKQPTAGTYQRIRSLKHELLELRRVVWPMRELILDLRRDAHECLSPTTQIYIRDVYDHILIIFELVENYRDLVSDLMEMHMSVVSQRTNEVMKVLTIISTIFVPLTFLAGVYGMNMPIPENSWDGTYVIFWVICICTIAGMLYWFRRNHWF